LDDDLLKKVNENRKGTPYTGLAAYAAIALVGDATKKDLTMIDNPFLRSIQPGANKDGYWTHDHMLVQLEDVMDVMKVQYPGFDILNWIDHSSSHDKLLLDGLNVNRMNEGFGGKQPPMHESIITAQSLGPFEHDLKVKAGDSQKMVYAQDAPDELGPHDMSLAERHDRRYDRPKLDPKTKQPITRKEKLNVNGIRARILAKDANALPSGYVSKERLLAIAKDREVDLTEVETIVMVPGWTGKTKGVKQTAWERGLLDPNKTYTMHGKKDKDGKIDQSTSLVWLLSQCLDFKEEVSAIRKFGDDIGMRIEQTPKYHAEIAGEGVEYDWALGKNCHKRSPLSKRKTMAGFRKSATYAVGRENMTLERARGCARRARQYIVAYQWLKVNDNNPDALKDIQSNSIADVEAVKRHLKPKKSHRGADWLDAGYLKQLEAL
jgi:hypothetical protein